MEGPAGVSPGLGMLPIRSILETTKVVQRVTGTTHRHAKKVTGYEIHVGQSQPANGLSIAHDESGFQPMFQLTRGNETPWPDGMRSKDGRVWGTYLHGLFDSPEFLQAFLSEMRPQKSSEWSEAIHERTKNQENSLDNFANLLRDELDLNHIFSVLGLEKNSLDPSSR